MAKDMVHWFAPDVDSIVDNVKLARVCDSTAAALSVDSSAQYPQYLHAVAMFSEISVAAVCRNHQSKPFTSLGDGIVCWHRSLCLSRLNASRKFGKQRGCAMLFSVLLGMACGNNFSMYQLRMLKDLLFGDHARNWLHTDDYHSVQWADLDPSDAC